MVDADVDGVLHGQLNAMLTTDTAVTEQGGSEDA
jgi:hypothetical protein